jgi:hypothetical protein
MESPSEAGSTTKQSIKATAGWPRRPLDYTQPSEHAASDTNPEPLAAAGQGNDRSKDRGKDRSKDHSKELLPASLLN